MTGGRVAAAVAALGALLCAAGLAGVAVVSQDRQILPRWGPPARPRRPPGGARRFRTRPASGQ